MIDYRTPLIEVAPEDIRQAAIASAKQATNRSAAIREHRFRELLPRPPKGSQLDLYRMFRIIQLGVGKIRTEGMSTCGLVASTLLSRVLALHWEGYDSWRYPRPYNKRDGSGLGTTDDSGQVDDAAYRFLQCTRTCDGVV